MISQYSGGPIQTSSVVVYCTMRSILWLMLLGVGAQIRPPAPAASSSARASIQGVVIRAGAAAGANVFVELKPGNVSVTTRADGAFSFRNLGPGRYTISITRDGFIPQDDPRRGLTFSGLTLNLTEGETLKDLVLPMSPAPVISGQVFDPHGEPLAAALVQAYMRQYTPYGPRVKIVKKTLTNDMGQFRLFGLNFGEYAVSAGYSERDRASAIGSVRLSSNVSNPDDGYATVFYGGTANMSEARLVHLAPGLDAGNLNIHLSERPRWKLRGRVVPNIAGSNIVFAPKGSNLVDANYFVRPNANGQFEIRGVSPGSYVLTAMAEGLSSDVLPISVANNDVEGLTLSMASTIDIPGRVVLEGRSTSNFSGMRVNVVRSSVEVHQTLQSPVRADGTFALAGIGPGEYDILVERLPPGAYVKSINLGGLNALAGQVRFIPFQPLQIVLGLDAGTVGGRVTTASDPAAGAQVVLIPDSRLRRRTDRYIAAFTDAAGNFQLSAIPPGRYTAYAFEQIEPGMYYAFAYSAEVNTRFADRGIPVNVGEKTTTIELKAIPAIETAGGLR